MESKLTIYDITASMVWQQMHAYEFVEEENADEFINRMEGTWLKKPCQDMHKRKRWNVCNTAGCYIMSFNSKFFNFT